MAKKSHTKKVTPKSYPKILETKHSGKLRPHRHTSYLSLLLLLFITAMPLSFASNAAAVAAVDTGYQVSGVVPGQTPSQTPTIANITNGHSYTSNDPITVHGSCQNATLVELFKNQVLAGVTVCNNGSYDLSIDLFIGSNTLLAQSFNSADVGGPQSAPLTVSFLPAGTTLTSTSELNVLGVPADQFYVTSQMFYSGTGAGEIISWPLTIVGGQAPYALSVGWGDGKTDLSVLQTAGPLTISHAYKTANPQANGYPVIVKITDKSGAQSYLQLTAIVHGTAQVSGVGKIVGGGYSTSTAIRIAWQILGFLIIVVFSFWVGERREIRVIKHRQTLRTA
jgi:hypothetical protein